MSALEDIRAAATAARGTIDTAITHAASALHEAQTKVQQLTALGLTGAATGRPDGSSSSPARKPPHRRAHG